MSVKKYSESHEWVEVLEDGTALIGLSEHAVEELLLADGTPNPDSVGRYLLLHVAEIGYMEIKSFFEFN